jgi:hypothetical protein
LRMSQTVIRKSRMQGCPERRPGVMVILESRLSTAFSCYGPIMARRAEPVESDVESDTANSEILLSSFNASIHHSRHEVYRSPHNT